MTGYRPALPAPGPEPSARPRGRPGPARPAIPGDHTGGAEGNERLTAAAGAVLLVLFAAEGVTILSIHRLITLHFFLGMLLLGPVALKTGSVIYRFARYYAGSPGYRRQGPPVPLLRLLGPLVLVTSVGVLGTGVALAFARSAAGPWLFLHKAFFVVWFGVMTVHVLAYVWRLPRLIGPDLIGRAGLNRRRPCPGRPDRTLDPAGGIGRRGPAHRGDDSAPGRALGGVPPHRVTSWPMWWDQDGVRRAAARFPPSRDGAGGAGSAGPRAAAPRGGSATCPSVTRT